MPFQTKVRKCHHYATGGLLELGGKFTGKKKKHAVPLRGLYAMPFQTKDRKCNHWATGGLLEFGNKFTSKKQKKTRSPSARPECHALPSRSSEM